MTIEQPKLFGQDSERFSSDIGDHQKALDDLRSKLPELKELPGYPNGSDDAVQAMSHPPYYTAVPNPYMREWIESLDREEREYVDPGPYAADISVGKTHPIYKAHRYPTKVPHQAIMRFILHYTKPGDVILDGFCGTGMTGVAAQACANPDLKTRQEIEAEMGSVEWGGRRAVLQDLSPSATFIAAGLNLPLDADAFDEASTKILNQIEDQYGWMYETNHTDGTKRKIDYTVWSEVFTCPTCASAIVFYDAAFIQETGKVRDSFNCQECSTELNKRSLERRKVNVRLVTGETIERLDLRPVKIHYRVGKTKLSKNLDENDHEVLKKITSDGLSEWAPTHELPYMYRTHVRDAIPQKGFTSISSLWPDRSIASLSIMWQMAKSEPDPLTRIALKFWIEQAFVGLSWLNKYSANDFSQVNRAQNGVYYIASLTSECSIEYNLHGSSPNRGKRRNLVNTWKTTPDEAGDVIISTGSSTKIDLPDDSIDYVFTDPPFGFNFYYLDLAYMVESWHGLWGDRTTEAIINQSSKIPRSAAEYQALMTSVFSEYRRVLKPGRWITVEFSNSHTEVWLAIQQALTAAGFVVADTRVFDKEHSTFAQFKASNAVKRDLIISAYKPSEKTSTEIRLSNGTEDSAWLFVREHLAHIPITQGSSGSLTSVRERYADRIYDRMVAYHVHNRITVPLTAAEFYSGLERYFPNRDSMYFLESQVEVYERKRLTIKELVQSEQFITSESSAVQWLRQFLKKFHQSRRRGAEYSEIMSDFFREVQEGLPAYEQLPELRLMLEQNFLQDDTNGWYVPDPRKAADLEKLRRRSLLVEFERYSESTGKLDRFRSEALKVGFDDAYDRDDQQTIVNVGSRVPLEVFAEDQSLLFYFDNAKQLTKS